MNEKINYWLGENTWKSHIRQSTCIHIFQENQQIPNKVKDTTSVINFNK